MSLSLCPLCLFVLEPCYILCPFKFKCKKVRITLHTRYTCFFMLLPDCLSLRCTCCMNTYIAVTMESWTVLVRAVVTCTLPVKTKNDDQVLTIPQLFFLFQNFQVINYTPEFCFTLKNTKMQTL